jgi:hypothetical protein
MMVFITGQMECLKLNGNKKVLTNLKENDIIHLSNQKEM